MLAHSTSRATVTTSADGAQVGLLRAWIADAEAV
jgi:hypothetical protein